MNTQKAKDFRRKRRKRRVRKKIFGSADRPRLSVFRSLRHIYAQIVDDVSARTLVSASTKEKALAESLESTGNKDAATAIGKALAARAVEAGVKQVAFDRSGYRYHGRVKALADAVREGGVKL